MEEAREEFETRVAAEAEERKAAKEAEQAAKEAAEGEGEGEGEGEKEGEQEEEEKLPEFDEKEFVEDFDEENPPIVVPPEVIDDIDNDWEVEAQAEDE